MAKYHDEYKLPKRQYDPETIWFTANQFLKVADQSGTENVDSWLAVPEITNRGFACELFIKSVLSKLNKPLPSHHNLAKLFNDLPPEIQSEVRKCLGYSQDEFSEKLYEISDIFEECRYVYEYKKLNLDVLFLRKFSRVISQISAKQISDCIS